MPGTVIGIDLSGTRVIVAGLHDGRLGESRVARTDCSDAEGLIDQLAVLIERLEAPDLEGAGVGVDRVVDYESGRIIPAWRPRSPAANGSVNLPLENVPLGPVLRERVGVPVSVDKHANVAALAEA